MYNTLVLLFAFFTAAMLAVSAVSLAFVQVRNAVSHWYLDRVSKSRKYGIHRNNDCPMVPNSKIISGRRSLVIIKGPQGSGKTTEMNILAAAFKQKMFVSNYLYPEIFSLIKAFGCKPHLVLCADEVRSAYELYAMLRIARTCRTNMILCTQMSVLDLPVSLQPHVMIIEKSPNS